MVINSNDLPTVVINKFQVVTGGHLLRFSFGEQVVVNGTISFHCAIMMTAEHAKEMADCIYKTITDMQQIKIIDNDNKVTIN